MLKSCFLTPESHLKDASFWKKKQLCIVGCLNTRLLTLSSNPGMELAIHNAGDTVVKNLPASAGDTRDTGLIPGLGRSLEEGNDNPLQYSCL